MSKRTLKSTLSVLLTLLMLLFVCNFGAFAEYVEPKPLPSGYTALPNSPAGLSEGAYWFDMATYRSEGGAEANTFYFNESKATITYEVISDGLNYGYEVEWNVKYSGLFSYLRIVGYNMLPRNLYVDSTGYAFDFLFAEWEFSHYDVTSETTSYDPEYEVFNTATFYLSTDESTIISVTKDGIYRFNRTTNLYNIFNHLKTNPMPGATLLPTSPDGLADGSKWLDLENAIQVFSEIMQQGYRDATWYLSADGQTVFGVSAYNSGIMDENSEYLSHFIRTIGENPYEDFDQLPLSPEGLTAGSKWFDMDAFLTETGAPPEAVEAYASAEVYLSKDGTTILLSVQGYTMSFSSNGDADEAAEFAVFSSYIKTVEAPPHVHNYYITIVTKYATCKEKGEKTLACECGASYTEEIDIDPTNHVHTENKDAVAANCKETGFTAGVYCNDCQTWVSGHAVIAVDATKHADLDENGNCPRCGKHVKDVEKPTEPSDNKPTDEKPAEKLNFFQRIIQWFRNLFAKLFRR